ncbi:MAG TPA: hypothetical protein VN436_00495, partial [Holophaga sp.]|nr:hypothetical protein [Holophaga sp.]
SMALVSFKESRILLAWGRRGGLKLDWRGVPTQDEIRAARTQRLAARLDGQEAPAFLDLARTLLAERDPAPLVATLLSLIEDEAHAGFDIPESPKAEPRREKKTYAPRPGEKSGWTPQPKGDRPFRPAGKTFEDRNRNPKAGGFKSKEYRPSSNPKAGKPFKKKV